MKKVGMLLLAMAIGIEKSADVTTPTKLDHRASQLGEKTANLAEEKIVDLTAYMAQLTLGKVSELPSRKSMDQSAPAEIAPSPTLNIMEISNSDAAEEDSLTEEQTQAMTEDAEAICAQWKNRNPTRSQPPSPNQAPTAAPEVTRDKLQSRNNPPPLIASDPKLSKFFSKYIKG